MFSIDNSLTENYADNCDLKNITQQTQNCSVNKTLSDTFSNREKTKLTKTVTNTVKIFG